MKVEKAGMGDIEALVKMRLCYLIEDNGSLDAQDLAAIKRDLPGYFQAHLDRDLFIYVIRDGQNIVSCAFLLIVEKPMSPAFINGRTGTVLNVYTCPSHRRKGCAKIIMEALISEAKKMEISVIGKHSNMSTKHKKSLHFCRDGMSRDHSSTFKIKPFCSCSGIPAGQQMTRGAMLL